MRSSLIAVAGHVDLDPRHSWLLVDVVVAAAVVTGCANCAHRIGAVQAGGDAAIAGRRLLGKIDSVAERDV